MFHRLTRRLLTAGAAVATIAAGGAAALGAAPAQAASSNLFASVTANGTLAHGNGVTRVTHIGTGRYEVTFSADVRSCAYVATTINSASQALQVFTAGGHLGAEGAYVETRTRVAGSPTGRSTWPLTAEQTAGRMPSSATPPTWSAPLPGPL